MLDNDTFDAAAEALRLSELRKQKRKRPAFYRSRLDKHGHKILKLFAAGANYAEIALFLREQRIVVAQTTVSRWIQKRIS